MIYGRNQLSNFLHKKKYDYVSVPYPEW
ncbi:hypothetical protein DCS65_20580, partial [Bacillus subtilis]